MHFLKICLSGFFLVYYHSFRWFCNKKEVLDDFHLKMGHCLGGPGIIPQKVFGCSVHVDCLIHKMFTFWHWELHSYLFAKISLFNCYKHISCLIICRRGWRGCFIPDPLGRCFTPRLQLHWGHPVSDRASQCHLHWRKWNRVEMISISSRSLWC